MFATNVERLIDLKGQKSYGREHQKAAKGVLRRQTRYLRGFQAEMPLYFIIPGGNS